MHIKLSVYGVDGESEMVYTSESPDAVRSAIKHLKKHDHEGSGLTLKIETTNADQVYKLLEGLAQYWKI